MTEGKNTFSGSYLISYVFLFTRNEISAGDKQEEMKMCVLGSSAL